MTLCVVYLLVLTGAIRASDFRGATINWAPVYSADETHFNGTVCKLKPSWLGVQLLNM